MMFSQAFTDIYLTMDRFLIFFFRIIDQPLWGFFLGSTVLAFICVVIGEFSVSLAIRFNRAHIDNLNDDIQEKERLSMLAYRDGDMRSYDALNKEATDAWGKRFFTMAAYSAGILWPIPMAMGWMQTRFADVEFALAFPLSAVFGNTVGYAFSFIPLYILCRILFKYLRLYLPCCKV
jgi:hypothetical protein